ncbi:ATP-binding protein [Luteolibacter marinus]|uniref:ATP-binding protein n=1 Tax=Luteolibacter marinus TaxID=2776705 RepID=UPI0018672962|nr:ATP-binding protein [Luteolibacter marinus]
MSTTSIRRTLLIRCGVGIGVLLFLLSAAIYLLVRGSLYRELDDSIKDTAAILANQVELEDESITYEWQEGIGTNRGLAEDALFQFWNEAHGTTTRSPSLHWRDLPKFAGVDGTPLMRSILLADGHRGRAVGLTVYPFVLPGEMTAMKERGRIIDPATLPHTLVVARDAEPVYHALTNLRLILAAGGLLTLGIGFLLVGRAIRSSLEPIDRLSDEVQARASHQLDEALDLPDDLPAELTGLARSFDVLLSRVAAIRQRERDFIRHAAHELRTPIAGLRATTDLALSQERDAAAYAGHLRSCQQTAIDLGELVKRLSALARIGQPAAPASMEPVDVLKILASSLERFMPLAEARGLQVADETGSEPLMALGDAALLKIIFNNLLDNAVTYAAPGGCLRLRGHRTEHQVLVSISNPTEDFPDDPERLFEPLFRRESSRHDAESHLGIGLTLSLEAARAMNGELRAGKAEDRGDLEFTLVLAAARHPVAR